MYEYKVFRLETKSDQELKKLLEKITHDGWEPVQVDLDSRQVFARKSLILND
tara:strand:- start:354 stop:509 length:156 start_codon:yes stop_codon:yes gene_type:complete